MYAIFLIYNLINENLYFELLSLLLVSILIFVLLFFFLKVSLIFQVILQNLSAFCITNIIL